MHNVYNRHEDKYWLTPLQAQNIRAKIQGLLHPDPHSLAPEYLVRSVYFDSLDDQDYHDKLAGVENRRKVRLRTYDPASGKARLEVKYKQGDSQHKVSLWLNRDQCQDFLAHRYSSLRNLLLNNAYLQELYPLLITKCYRPKVWCEYRRQAFIHPLEDLRVTFDRHIRTSESQFPLFAASTSTTATLIEGEILEVKYRDQVPGFLAQILAPYDLTRSAISKYCHSRLNYYEMLD